MPFVDCLPPRACCGLSLTLFLLSLPFVFMCVHTSNKSVSASVSKHVSVQTHVQFQLTFYPCTCDIKDPQYQFRHWSIGLSIDSCIKTPCTTVGRNYSLLHVSLSPPVLRRECIRHNRALQIDMDIRGSACPPVSLPDGLSWSL